MKTKARAQICTGNSSSSLGNSSSARQSSQDFYLEPIRFHHEPSQSEPLSSRAWSYSRTTWLVCSTKRGCKLYLYWFLRKLHTKSQNFYTFCKSNAEFSILSTWTSQFWVQHNVTAPTISAVCKSNRFLVSHQAPLNPPHTLSLIRHIIHWLDHSLPLSILAFRSGPQYSLSWILVVCDLSEVVFRLTRSLLRSRTSQLEFFEQTRNSLPLFKS